jgi:hypothetical protein
LGFRRSEPLTSENRIRRNIPPTTINIVSGSSWSTGYCLLPGERRT